MNMHSSDICTAPASVGTSSPVAVLTRHAATSTVSSLAEIAQSSRRVWSDAAARRATPLDLATRGARGWTSMTDRREPRWHLPHRTVFSTPFAHVHDFSPANGDTGVVPTLVLPPQAGHSSHVVDFAPGQSQLKVLLDAGLTSLYAMEWRPATAATRHVTITDYLEAVDWAVQHAGGRVNLVGDCQGGWLAAIYASLHPERVHTLTLAGAPIDMATGAPQIGDWLTLLDTGDMAFYRALVASGGGVLPGRYQLAGFITLKPETEVERQLQLLTHLDDPEH